MAHVIVIGTRGSRLARWQAEHVASLLNRIAATSIVEIETAGDRGQYTSPGQRPTSELPASAQPAFGQGIFTKEIQRALLDGRISLAVHSLKDLPTLPVDGLTLTAVPPRGPSGDVFISRRHPTFSSLPPGAIVATSSLRRQAQILHLRPDLRIVPIRGNVDTRLRKLDEEGLDALVLAEAGVRRLGLASAITEILDPTWMLPAVGQGALALECRMEDESTQSFVRQLDDAATHCSVLAERALLRTLQGGCLVPVGAIATVHADRLKMRAAVLDSAGKHRVEGEISGPSEKAEELGQQLAADLLGRGARELLASSP
jgi:hydroxymethylbilane synthase